MIGINRRDSSSTGMHLSDTTETDINLTSNKDSSDVPTSPVKKTLILNDSDDNSNRIAAESDTVTLPQMPALDPLSSANQPTDPASPKDTATTTTIPSSPIAERSQDAATTVDGKPDAALTEAMTDEPVNATANPIAPVASNGQPVLQRSSSSQQQGMIIITKPRLKRPPLRAINLNSTPKKSILRKETAYPFIEQPVRSPVFKSQWLQSTVSKLAAMSGPATPTAYTANSPTMFQKLVSQATAAAVVTPQGHAPIPSGPPVGRPRTGPPVFVNNERPISFLESNESVTSLLSDKSLKRVRFSVGQLTTEHVFHNDDAYESEEETEPRKVPVAPAPVQPKKIIMTSEGVLVDDNIYTAKEILNYYLTACNSREEFPIERLINDMQIASSRPSNPLLTTIDLTGEPLPKRALDPISDVLTLEFGLKHLILDNCALEDDTLKMLLYSLLLTDTLTLLSLQDNKRIKSLGFKYVSVFVKKTKALKSLNISGIPMDKKAIEFLAQALKIGRLGFGSRLEELRMDRCGLRGNLLEIIAPAIRESNLRQVSMRSNRIGAAGGVWIGVMMRDYDDQPNKVIPINNEEQGFKRVFPGIVNPELLKRTRGIETLDVSDNDLRQGADYVAQTLRRNMSLKYLILANNNLDPARLVVLADALKLNIGLEALDLSNNRICGPAITGMNALTQKLVYNKTLTKLSLSNTGIQSEGAIALAEFLPETRSLVQLDLTGNDLVDIAGVMALSVSIRMNKSITCLDMNVPPNDAEFARLSRDILRACIRNMEAKTGSNEGMPSPDDMPTNTIFRHPSSAIIPEPVAPSVEDSRWSLLEVVAGELYRTRETLIALERALNREKAMRRDWYEHLYGRVAIESRNYQNGHTGEFGEDGQAPSTPTTPLVHTPEDKKMLDILKGVLYRAPPPIEQLYHQCKRHQANIMNLLTRVDNERAMLELESLGNTINSFVQAYRALFALPEMPPSMMVGKRTNSLPPATPTEQPSPETDNSSAVPQGQQEQEHGLDQAQVVPDVLTEEPGDDMESSFLLEDDDDMDDEVFADDALNDVRRTSLLVSERRSPTLTSTATMAADESANETPNNTYRGRGLKPTPVNTLDTGRVEGERSPSALASPLEKLRKAAEVEEGEVLRRGKDLLENALVEDVPAEMSGEELKIQILASEAKP
ncbi:hypothetical protein BGZ97_007054 [Linnemannia gamsii]|uniref:RNI-like protein n=1 Tax=Linnemannia gamsii TaxID=64522 RepID=A0A9P6REY6_9FUNG|nr:hypothetical protein BGZ97_007054 [Linnemannia gamsii]